MSRSAIAIAVTLGVLSAPSYARDDVSATVESVLASISRGGSGLMADDISNSVRAVERDRGSAAKPAAETRSKSNVAEDNADRDIREVIAAFEGKTKVDSRGVSSFEEIFGSNKSKTSQPVVDLDVVDVAPLNKSAKPLPVVPTRNTPRIYTFGPTRNGATLKSVAEQLLPSSNVTVTQMMWALYVKNPNAFANKATGALKPNLTLNVPEPDEVTSVSSGTAETRLSQMRAASKPSKSSS